MTTKNVTCGVTTSIFLWSVTFIISHLSHFSFFHLGREMYTEVHSSLGFFVCSLITVLDDCFSMGYLSISIKEPATPCIVLPPYKKKDLFLTILHDKPPNKNNQKVIIWFEGSFLYYFYRKACKLSVLYLSTLRSDYTSKPCYDFVSINSLI